MFFTLLWIFGSLDYLSVLICYLLLAIEIYRQKLQQCLVDGELSEEDVKALLRVRVMLCVPQKIVEAAHADVCGSLFEKVWILRPPPLIRSICFSHASLWIVAMILCNVYGFIIDQIVLSVEFLFIWWTYWIWALCHVPTLPYSLYVAYLLWCVWDVGCIRDSWLTNNCVVFVEALSDRFPPSPMNCSLFLYQCVCIGEFGGKAKERKVRDLFSIDRI